MTVPLDYRVDRCRGFASRAPSPTARKSYRWTSLATALDPIATAKIEELMQELKTDYTIVIVTHNMQQASRCSDLTAFLYLGRLVECGPTTKIFTKPSEPQTEDYIAGRFG